MTKSQKREVFVYLGSIYKYEITTPQHLVERILAEEREGLAKGCQRFELDLDVEDECLDVFGYRDETDQEYNARLTAEVAKDRAEFDRLKAKLETLGES